jgi:hypothetical protein
VKFAKHYVIITIKMKSYQDQIHLNVEKDLINRLKHSCLQNWFDANSACASVGGQLPTILSAEDNSFVTSLVNVSKLVTTSINQKIQTVKFMNNKMFRIKCLNV